MADPDPKPGMDDLEVDDLDTVAGGSGGGSLHNEAISGACMKTPGSPNPVCPASEGHLTI